MPRHANVTSFKPGNKLQASMTRGPNGRFVARVYEPETVVHFPVAHAAIADSTPPYLRANVGDRVLCTGKYIRGEGVVNSIDDRGDGMRLNVTDHSGGTSGINLWIRNEDILSIVSTKPAAHLEWTDCEPSTTIDEALAQYREMQRPQLQYPQIGHDRDESSSIDVLVGVGVCLGSTLIVIGVGALLGRVAGWW